MTKFICPGRFLGMTVDAAWRTGKL